ncbi:hypothetical protein BJF79_03850 [Actinomadura sp. CNU-125]|nr:hypothetical protein BJF79_03850 [Actinomadura sp. CNU-125]
MIVTRPSRWGNPWRIGEGPDALSREEVVRRFAQYLRDRQGPRASWYLIDYPSDAEIRANLAGRDLLCWCPLPAEGEPDVCHGAVLLAHANGLPGRVGYAPADNPQPWRKSVTVPTVGELL